VERRPSAGVRERNLGLKTMPSGIRHHHSGLRQANRLVLTKVFGCEPTFERKRSNVALNVSGC
jgi:hypothetical protein